MMDGFIIYCFNLLFWNQSGISNALFLSVLTDILPVHGWAPEEMTFSTCRKDVSFHLLKTDKR